MSWTEAARREFGAFPPRAITRGLDSLSVFARRVRPDNVRAIAILGGSVWTLSLSDVGERLRVIFLLEEGGDIWVIRAVQRRSSAQEPGQASDFDLLRKRIKQLRDVISVGKSDDWEVERGTDNVFSDFGTPEPSKRHLRATLASEIIRKLDVEQLSARDAGLITGMTSGDLMRIRHVKLKRFTIDQMLSILYRLNLDVNLSISLSPRRSRFVQRPITVPDHARAVADLLS